MTCVGAPVFDPTGVVAAVSVSVPSVRVPAGGPGPLTAAVKRTAGLISDRLRQPG